MVIDINRRQIISLLLYGSLLPVYAKEVRDINLSSNLMIGSAFNKFSKSYYGVFDINGKLICDVKLDTRAHDSIFIRELNKIVIISRRPKNLIYVLDLNKNRVVNKIVAPNNRHFYGHGVFSNKYKLMFVTENNFSFDDERAGSIGIYDPYKNFKRVGEYLSYGIGPHELKINNNNNLIIANGGLLTNPDYPRIILNLSNISSNISDIDISSGNQNEKFFLDIKLKNHSIRHIDLDNQGNIFGACQVYNKLEKSGSLVFLKKNNTAHFFKIKKELINKIQQYTGSIKVDTNSRELYATFPKGNRLLVWNYKKNVLIKNIKLNDVCGLAVDKKKNNVYITNGNGQVYERLKSKNVIKRFRKNLNFDNHCMLFMRKI